MTADQVATFAIKGEPVSKARARFTNYGSKTRAYTPAKVTNAEKAVAEAYVKAGGKFEPDNQAAFGVDVTFHSGTRQRRDVDNMLKLILDGLNGVAWVDDTQVVDVVGRKRFGSREDARTEVTIYRVGTLKRLTADCEWCNESYPTWESHIGAESANSAASARFDSAQRTVARPRVERRPSGALPSSSAEYQAGSAQQRFCSRNCHSASGRTVIPCKVCGNDFEQYKSWVTQRPYCSAACVKENNRLKAAARRRRAS